VVSQCLDNVGHRNLKNDVHTTLQVQTKSNLGLKALLIAVDTQVFYRILIILLAMGSFSLAACPS
jgi:hypothetical protein